MPTTPPAIACARRSSMAMPARCRTCRPRSAPPTASATACVAPANTLRPPGMPSTAWSTIRTWPRCAAWRAIPLVAIADGVVLEAFLEEVVHHVFRAFGRERVVEAARRAFGVRQREAWRGGAEVHEQSGRAGGGEKVG